MSVYRLVSFDGGGILGAIGARFVDRLHGERPALLDDVDLYAGTSVGSVSAAALALGLSPSALMRLYRPPLIKGAFLPFPTRRGDRGEDRPLYADAAAVLQSLLGIDLPLAELERSVFLPTFYLGAASGRWEPVFQTNLPGSTTAETSLVDAALRSAACPIYWPTQDGFVDGWIVANNPCLAAVLAAADASQGGQALDDLRVLSFGVGRPSSSLEGGQLKWGRSQWLGGEASDWSMVESPLMDMIFTNQSLVPALQTEQLLGADRFLRVDLDLEAPVPMDATDRIDELIDLVDAVDLAPYVRWIDANWC